VEVGLDVERNKLVNERGYNTNANDD